MNYLFSKHYHPNKQNLYQQVFNLTASMTESYPNYYDWFQKTFLTGLQQGKNAYFLAMEGSELAGCCLIKNAKDEKKICTLFVHPAYRRQGIGRSLMDRAMAHLGSDVEISLSSKHLASMTRLLCDFGFYLSHMEYGLYAPDQTEYFCYTNPQKITHNSGLKINTKDFIQLTHQ